MKLLILFTLFLSTMAETAFADCPNKLLKTKSRNAKYYEWTGTCFSWGRCKPCGPKHQERLYAKTTQFGTCTRKDIANQRADGCSAPWGTPYKNKFKHACDEHDVCYSSPWADKEICDKQFFRNMYDMCQHDNEKPCLAAAATFYQAVVLYGDEPYTNGQKFARKNCQ